MKMKKLVALLLASTMVLGMMTGCSGSSEEADTSSDSTTEGSAEVTTITVAALESAYGTEMWDRVAEAFTETMDGTIEVEVVTDINLEDVIGAQMKAGEYPDVIHLGIGREAGLTETFIKEENMQNLTDMLASTVPGEEVTVADKLAGGFTDNSITNPYGDGETYLAPMFYSPTGLFYNQGLFDEMGWEVPTTWDEMWELGDLAAEEGIALFTYPTTGYFDSFFYALFNIVGGPEFFNSATTYEEGVWQTDEATAAFDIVTKLATYTESTTPANANNDNYRKNQQLILENKALFMPNGNWVVGEMADAPTADGFEWGFTALPAVEEGGDQYAYTYFEQAWMPAEAEHVEEGKAFIAFLYSDAAAEIFAEYGAIQPINGIADSLEGDMALFYNVYEDGAKAAMGSFATTDPVAGVSISDSLFGTVDSLVTGDTTEEEWITKVTEASDALRGALK